uniref:Uncharacterized protein n=1 Tax=Oryza barthii TaxID=65489 RepID=A0A0D3FZY2_9ORYZ
MNSLSLPRNITRITISLPSSVHLPTNPGVKPQFANEDTAVKMQKIGLCDSLLPEQSRKSLHLPVKLFRPQFSRNGYSMQVRLANGNGN